MGFELPAAQSVAVNPTQEEMRTWVEAYMPNITVTEFGNLAARAGFAQQSVWTDASRLFSVQYLTIS